MPYTKLIYWSKMGRKLNLKNPKTFNEKLQWLKLYDKNPKYIKLVDKYEVRKFVMETIGAENLVPIIGVYDTPDDIPFDQLPEKYVLKCTHDSGTVIIKNSLCRLSEDEIRDILRKSIKKNYFYKYREWPYKNVKPRIICEELIKTVDNNPPKDYKIFCFDGVPKFLFIASDRGRGTKFDFFDINWNKYSFTQHYPNSDYDIQKPSKWNHMFDCAAKLSKGLPHVRVDFYVDADDSVLFSEMTLTHFGGVEPFKPDYYDTYLGELLIIPKLQSLSGKG